MTDLKAICIEIESAARQAAEFILRESEVFDLNNAESKGLNNFVSYVDKQSEKMLIERLTPLIPEAGFIAEEGTSVKRGLKYNWVIDPLDGTTNFLHRVHPYAVSIGLKEDDEVIAGVVHEVAGNETLLPEGRRSPLNGKIIYVQRPEIIRISCGYNFYNLRQAESLHDLLKYLVVNSHGSGDWALHQ
jgi:myo-inositol-1(or 4)-monophosphatase